MSKYRVAAGGLVLSAAALVGIATHEGYVGQAYDDIGGVHTIGFGETKGVMPGQKTDPVRALIQLQASAQDHVRGMVACIKVPISQGEFDAYADFTYNLGVGAFCGSNIVRKLNAGDYAGACRALLDWDHVGTKQIAGLTRRRQEEYQKCSSD